MTQEAVMGVNDLEQLQRRFEEFRNVRPRVEAAAVGMVAMELPRDTDAAHRCIV
jgi:hypothetical protein